MTSQLLEFAQTMQQWHAAKLAHLESVSEAVAEGVVVKLGSEEDAPSVTLTAREALIFKLGMEAGVGEFKQLPFTLSKKTADAEEDEDLEG